MFILYHFGAKNCHCRWLHIYKVIGKSIADHDRDRRSWDFQNMIVSDCRSLIGKIIVSDCRSWKKVSCLTLCIHNFWLSSPLWLLLKWMVLVFEKWCRIVVPTQHSAIGKAVVVLAGGGLLVMLSSMLWWYVHDCRRMLGIKL